MIFQRLQQIICARKPPLIVRWFFSHKSHKESVTLLKLLLPDGAILISNKRISYHVLNEFHHVRFIKVPEMVIYQRPPEFLLRWSFITHIFSLFLLVSTIYAVLIRAERPVNKKSARECRDTRFLRFRFLQV